MEKNDDKPRCLRLRGVPFSALEKNVRDFFRGLDVTEVIFLYNDDGRPSGECYCKFGNDTDLDAAMGKDRQMIGRRYIEIFRVGALELANYEKKMKLANLPISKNAGYLRVIGLPFKCTDDDLVYFFKGFNVEEVILGKEPGERGRLTGEAYVRFVSKEEAEKAMQLDGQHLGHRYLELHKVDFRAYEVYKCMIREASSSSSAYKPFPTRSDMFASHDADNIPPFTGTNRNGRHMHRHSTFANNRYSPYGYPQSRGGFDPAYDMPPRRSMDTYNNNYLNVDPYSQPYGSQFNGFNDYRDGRPEPLFPRNGERSSTVGKVGYNAWDDSREPMPLLGNMWDINGREGASLLDDHAVLPYDEPNMYSHNEMPIDRVVDGGMRNYDMVRGRGSGAVDISDYRRIASNQYGPYEMDKYVESRTYDRMVGGSSLYSERDRYTQNPSYGSRSSLHDFPLAPNKLHMRGLPFRVTGYEIEQFFSPLPCVEIKVGFLPDGRASGDGIVEFETTLDAELALKKDHQSLGKRYVELFSPRELSHSTIKRCQSNAYKTIGGRVMEEQKRRPVPLFDSWCNDRVNREISKYY